MSNNPTVSCRYKHRIMCSILVRLWSAAVLRSTANTAAPGLKTWWEKDSLEQIPKEEGTKEPPSTHFPKVPKFMYAKAPLNPVFQGLMWNYNHLHCGTSSSCLPRLPHLSFQGDISILPWCSALTTELMANAGSCFLWEVKIKHEVSYFMLLNFGWTKQQPTVN